MTKRQAGLHEGPSGFAGSDGAANATLDPTEAFLFRTLVWRPTLLSRNGVSYISVRRWRSSVKDYQIDALRQVKKSPSAQFVAACARDVIAGLDGMIAGQLYTHVVPVPCSRSAPDACLSVLLAEKLAARVRLTFVEALAAERAEGASHPRKNADRPAMTLREAVSGPTLLVDDVATSGRHLEEGARLLRQSAPALLAVAWIGGGAVDEQE
ncbi:MAG: hypothetical protein JNK46_16610 [Methylobacteriaceae bacterium]|nr:hypothetical protein [Methylobacteriaceae bacterium]